MVAGLPEAEVEIVVRADTAELPEAGQQINDLADSAVKSLERMSGASERTSDSFRGVSQALGGVGDSVGGAIHGLTAARGALEGLLVAATRLSNFDFAGLFERGRESAQRFAETVGLAERETAATKVEVTNNVVVGVGEDQLRTAFDDVQRTILSQVQATQADLAHQVAVFREASRQGR